MKKGIYLLTCIFFLCCISCKQDEEKYSCNSEIDSWVKQNLSMIKAMDRNTWKTLPEDLKQASLRAFSKEQKSAFWKNKIQETMNLEWTTQELDHLSLLYTTVVSHPNWFTGNLSEQTEDQLYLFCSLWTDNAVEKLKWSKNLVNAILCSGNKLLDKKGNTQANSIKYIKSRAYNTPISSISDDGACNCNINHDFCPNEPLELTCKSSKCSGSTGGCGWFCVQECDGRCNY